VSFSKGRNWAFYIFQRLTGITVRPATAEELNDPMASMSGGRDRDTFPEFYAEYDAASGLGKRLGNRIVVNAPITYCGDQQVGRDIANLKAAVVKAKDKHPGLAAFLPVVAPASAMPGAKIEHYKDEESFLFALAEACIASIRRSSTADSMSRSTMLFCPICTSAWCRR
jgi:5-methyltetrahydropteroyltriglutamate--homocysteine methyltransferase